MPGVDKTFKELEALGKALRNKIIRQAQRKAAKVLATEIKAEAPVESGRTKRSVKVRAGKRKKDVISTVVVVSGGHDDPFIGQVEFGNKNQAPNPFIRRSIAAKRGEAVDVMAEEIDAGIRKGK